MTALGETQQVHSRDDAAVWELLHEGACPYCSGPLAVRDGYGWCPAEPRVGWRMRGARLEMALHVACPPAAEPCPLCPQETAPLLTSADSSTASRR